MTVLDALLTVVAVFALLPAGVLFVQVLAARPATASMPASRRPALAVLVPAHDESAIIGSTLAALIPQLRAGDRLLVVADNCSDATAAIAKASGAEVIERNSRDLRGKGYALDFGIRHLEHDPPEVVIIIDADCRVGSGALDRLARQCAASGRPVQALYLMHAPTDAGLKMRIAEFAWLVRNHVRPLGYHRFNLPCQLHGTGMAFTWPCISGAALASGHIVEDLKLGIDLARAGTPAMFCPEAVVSSFFPGNAEGVATQRTRWEHGHLGMILGTAPRLLLQGLRSFDRNLLALALDLCVPPLALLLLLTLALLAGTALLFAASGLLPPLALASTALAFLVLAVALSWSRFGRRVISLTDLAHAPLYALRKVPLYFAFLFQRQGEWVRSRRDGE